MLPASLLISDYLSAADLFGQAKNITRFRQVIPVTNKQRKPSPRRRTSSSANDTDRVGSEAGAWKVDKESIIRIVVVDDHPLFRHGLVQLLNSEKSFSVCGEASSASEATVAPAEFPRWGKGISMTDLYFYLRGLMLREERGQTMAEYAVVLAVITAAVVAAIGILGGNISDKLTEIGGVITNNGN